MRSRKDGTRNYRFCAANCPWLPEIQREAVVYVPRRRCNSGTGVIELHAFPPFRNAYRTYRIDHHVWARIPHSDTSYGRECSRPCSLDTQITSMGPGVSCQERKGVRLLAGNHGLGDNAGFATSGQFGRAYSRNGIDAEQNIMAEFRTGLEQDRTNYPQFLPNFRAVFIRQVGCSAVGHLRKRCDCWNY